MEGRYNELMMSLEDVGMDVQGHIHTHMIYIGSLLLIAGSARAPMPSSPSCPGEFLVYLQNNMAGSR